MLTFPDIVGTSALLFELLFLWLLCTPVSSFIKGATRRLRLFLGIILLHPFSTIRSLQTSVLRRYEPGMTIKYMNTCIATKTCVSISKPSSRPKINWFTKASTPETNSRDHDVIVIVILIVYLRRRLDRMSFDKAFSRKDLLWVLQSNYILI